MLVVVAGEVDVGTVSELETVLMSCAGTAKTAIWLDLSRVTFLGGVGVDCLTRAHKYAQERSVTIRVKGCSPHARKVLDITGVGPHFGLTVQEGRPWDGQPGAGGRGRS